MSKDNEEKTIFKHKKSQSSGKSDIFNLKQGNIICLEFDPQTGKEMKGWHPALVLSPASYNKRSSLIIICPITSKVKGWPWEVLIPGGLPISGAILVDQIKSVDIKMRRARYECDLPSETVEEVLGKIETLLLS